MLFLVVVSWFFEPSQPRWIISGLRVIVTRVLVGDPGDSDPFVIW